MEEKGQRNLLLLLILMAAGLLAYQWWLGGRSKPKAQEKPKEAKVEKPAPTGPTTPSIAPVSPELITVETDRAVYRLTKKGGRLRELVLKGFRGPDGGEGVVLIKDGEFFAWEGDTSLVYQGDEGVIRVSGERSVRFKGPGGEKVYTFREEDYTFYLWVSSPRLLLWPGLSVTERDRKMDLREMALLAMREGKIISHKLGKLKKEEKSEDGVQWAGLRNKYFLFAVLDGGFSLRGGAVGDTGVWAELNLGQPRTVKVYAGPIDREVLVRAAPGLAGVYSFGFFLIAPFAQAIFFAFRWLHKLIPNYGWVIVIFALLMKIIFSPLTYKTYASMSRMQALRPKLEAIQKKYKDDPELMQRKIMELYREYKVNPFSGCLPVLLQLPIFWALYQVLRTTIDLRAAPWILWIQDLSYKDPYYVLPVVMGLVSLGVSLLQPTADRNSRIMGMVMAGVFTFVFLNFPSGIVLYWLVYNIFSALEQALYRRLTLKKGGAK